MIKVKPIEWSAEQPATETVNYNHVIGNTPLGRILITWKGWKDQPYYTIDEAPFGWRNGGYSLSDARQVAYLAYRELVLSCLVPDDGNDGQG